MHILVLLDFFAKCVNGINKGENFICFPLTTPKEWVEDDSGRG